MGFLKNLWAATQTTAKAALGAAVGALMYIGAPGATLGVAIVQTAKRGWANVRLAWQLGLADWRQGRRFKAVAVMATTVIATKLALLAIVLLTYGLFWALIAAGIFFAIFGWHGAVLLLIAAFLWNLSGLYLNGGVYDDALV